MDRTSFFLTPSSFLRGTLAAALAAIAFAGSASAWAASGDAADLQGSWRVVRGVAGPWVKAAAPRPDVRAWLGQAVRFEAARVAGPGVLNCRQARYEPTRMPPDGLFQGTLPPPAAEAARAIGFAAGSVSGTRLSCDVGVFEFHRADANTLLVAVDNVVWTLDRSPGSSADAQSPESAVQQLLERHFAGGMGFDAATLQTKSGLLSQQLLQHARAYLARSKPGDEVPSIDGDPFTDSQEYPTRFSVGRATLQADRALVPVHFADGYSQRRVVYRLVRESAGWRVDDLRYAHGPALSALLK